MPTASRPTCKFAYFSLPLQVFIDTRGSSLLPLLSGEATSLFLCFSSFWSSHLTHIAIQKVDLVVISMSIADRPRITGKAQRLSTSPCQAPHVSENSVLKSSKALRTPVKVETPLQLQVSCRLGCRLRTFRARPWFSFFSTCLAQLKLVTLFVQSDNVNGKPTTTPTSSRVKQLRPATNTSAKRTGHRMTPVERAQQDVLRAFGGKSLGNVLSEVTKEESQVQPLQK